MGEKRVRPDFSECAYTAVISDLHLCEAEPEHPKFPLWKKYKTREFFFDDVFCQFLKKLVETSQGETIELILNGDIFDFDSVTDIPSNPEKHFFQPITWLERERGLHPQEGKSLYKITKILEDHREWVDGLRWFIQQGHRAIFVVGNHDLELYWPTVQERILKFLDLPSDLEENVRFNDWFYISNKDTLIEHGHQYDPYCLCPNPVHPFIERFGNVEVRIPFGNLATRYMINGMGYFNPHVDTNFIMDIPEYVKFFFKYMVRAQPFLLLTWFFGAIITLIHSIWNRLAAPLRDPLTIENRMDEIAFKANAKPRIVRQLRALTVAPATSNPIQVLRELWLDRAFLLLAGLYIIFQIFLFSNQFFSFSILWMFIPFLLFLPPFIFYSKSVSSDVIENKKPNSRILDLSCKITGVQRVIYGHTHLARHEFFGDVEHLNSGCWSPAFLDVECTRSIDQKTFVLLSPDDKGERKAKLFQFIGGEIVEFHLSKNETARPESGVL